MSKLELIVNPKPVVNFSQDYKSIPPHKIQWDQFFNAVLMCNTEHFLDILEQILPGKSPLHDPIISSDGPMFHVPDVSEDERVWEFSMTTDIVTKIDCKSQDCRFGLMQINDIMCNGWMIAMQYHDHVLFVYNDERDVVMVSELHQIFNFDTIYGTRLDLKGVYDVPSFLQCFKQIVQEQLSLHHSHP